MQYARFHNPKTHVHSEDTWYEYYADYSQSFVEDVLDHFASCRGARVLDPWNGSGTTTQVAEDRGLRAYGYDINPAMVVVAKARRVDPDCSTSLLSLCKDIVGKASNYTDATLLEADLLAEWLSNRSVGTIRNIERAIQRLLIDQDYAPLSKMQDLNGINSLVSVFYACLFQTVRDMLTAFRSSNPTWIKIPRTSDEVLNFAQDDIFQAFTQHVTRTMDALESRKATRLSLELHNAVIDIASSTLMPMSNGHADVVISSPPYCTRIDYAVATRPELAVLGYSKVEMDDLRDKMIGTTTIFNKELAPEPEWGESCCSFLASVSNHKSKASNTYYYHTFLQYFDSIYRSLTEINRVLSGNGVCILVVQDSYYKDVHNDLPRTFLEMGLSLNWCLNIREDYPIHQTMAGINRGTRRYRSSSNAVESVLVFNR